MNCYRCCPDHQLTNIHIKLLLTKINIPSYVLEIFKYLHKNICFMVRYRCAICPATLLANTKMQYLLQNVYHLK